MEIFGRLDYNQTQNEVDSMGRTTIEIMGTRFVLIPEAELEAIEEASLPAVTQFGD